MKMNMEEEEEEEALTFQTRRDSEAASRLKAIISDLLPQLPGDYSDDVLAEYITVLVCNGKSQRQAIENLEAFLGEQSEGFVSCLWKLLLEEFSRDEQENFASDPKTAAEFGFHGAHVNRQSNSERHEDYKSNTKNVTCGIQAKVENTSVLSEGKNMRILREDHINGSSKRVKATEKNDWNSSPSNYSRKISSIVVSDFQQPGDINPYKYKKVNAQNSSGILQQLYIPKKEMNFSYSQSNRPGYRDAPPPWKMKPRVSVWDRLGSQKSDLLVDFKNPWMPESGIWSHEKHMPHPNEPTFLAAHSERIKRSHREVTVVGDRSKSFKSPTARKLESGTVTCNGPYMTHNLTSKRHYSDISTNAGDDSVSQVSCVHHQTTSQDAKRPNSLSHQSEKSDLLSEILNAKQKLHRIEMQILQAKQLKKQKVGVLPSWSGELQHRQVDVASRTIHVTNVHFAATKEAISLFFARCGAVENVSIATNPGTWKPIGAAIVTFASKESADRAITLSGSTFYSRTVMVMRATETNGSSRSGQHNSWRRHLKWDRDSASTPIPPEASVRTGPTYS